MDPGIDQGIESVSHARYQALLRSTDLDMGSSLGSVTLNFPRYQSELDPEHWERVEAAVKFMDSLRDEIKQLRRSMK